MLEQALKEVTSPEAIREICIARASIKRLVEILNIADGKDCTGSGQKHIYMDAVGYNVQFHRRGKTTNVGRFSFDELSKAIQARDEWLANEKLNEKGRT